MRLAFLLFAALTWGQETEVPKPTIEQLQKQIQEQNLKIKDLEQKINLEIQRLNACHIDFNATVQLMQLEQKEKP